MKNLLKNVKAQITAGVGIVLATLGTVFSDKVEFNTGQTVTNFAQQADDGRINLGSIQQEANAIANGSTVKVYFTGQVTSPVGTVTVFNTDAVNTEGKRLILNLQ